MIGYNLFGFDLLFLIRRSWIMGVRVPQDAIMFGTGPYRNDTIIDLRAVWMCGMYDGFVSLNDLAKYFDVGETTSHMPFHDLWQISQRDAVEHLVTSVMLIHRRRCHGPDRRQRTLTGRSTMTSIKTSIGKVAVSDESPPKFWEM